MMLAMFVVKLVCGEAPYPFQLRDLICSEVL